MGRRRVAFQGPVILEWDETQVDHFLRDPNGELGETLMRALGEVVTAGAKRRALVRTGRMQSEITFTVARDAAGVYTDVLSPAQDPRTGFPYPIVHEGRKVRDRRPHRSLRPALRDIRKIATRGY